MPPESERDLIFTLLNVALVVDTWDDTPLGEGSGHNIGALLVDKHHQPITFARNESTARRDLTEHAELRLIRQHIAASPGRTELNKHLIYSSLEPCAMCAGMAAMTNIARVVYAQPDPVFGGAIERLSGYPKPLTASACPDRSLAAAFTSSGHGEVIGWLPTSSARQAFSDLAATLVTFDPVHRENAIHLANAQAFLEAPHQYP